MRETDPPSAGSPPPESAADPHEHHIKGRPGCTRDCWGSIGAKIEKLGKKKSDYDFYTVSSYIGSYTLAVPSGDTSHSGPKVKPADPTNDELNHRHSMVMGALPPSTYFQDD